MCGWTKLKIIENYDVIAASLNLITPMSLNSSMVDDLLQVAPLSLGILGA